MTGGGIFNYLNQRGPRTNNGSAGAVFQGYPQPSALAYDPENANVIAAGAIDSGVFLTTDSGANWMRLTDPFTGNVHLPRPRPSTSITNRREPSASTSERRDGACGGLRCACRR